MRSLAVDHYTAEEVEYRFRHPGRYRARFEVTDRDGNIVGNLAGVTDATVSFDIDRDIKGNLALTLTPEAEMADRLRNAPFQYRIRAYFACGPMHDGGMAEVPVGVFVWQRPNRIVGADEEVWTVDLPDLTGILDSGGPGLDTLIAFPNTRVVDTVKSIYRRAGFTDLSGIAESDQRFANYYMWSYRTPFSRVEYEVQHDISRNRDVKVAHWEPMDERPETWLAILSWLYRSLGWVAPHFDAVGLPIGKPGPDYSTVAPEMTYESSPDSIIYEQVSVDADLSSVGNRVLISEKTTTVDQFGPPAFAVHLDAFLPDHPLAKKQIGHYRDVPMPDTAAPSVFDLPRIGLNHLFEQLSFYEQGQVRTMAWPFHEPRDPIAVRVPGDPELDEAGMFEHRGWALDAMTGRQTGDVRRLHRLVPQTAVP